MPENSIVSTLIQSFPPVSKDQWKRAASREVNDQDPFEKLSWKNNDEIEFFPYYDREDLVRVSPPRFQLQPSKNSWSGTRTWQCAPLVTVRDATKANIISLDHLRHGADAVFFNLGSQFDVAFDDLLHNIEWQYCSLFFSIGQEHSESLRKYIIDNALPPDKLTGGFFWETFPGKGAVDFFLNDIKAFHSLGIHIPPDSAAREISHALTKGVHLFEEVADSSKDRTAVFNNIAFSISAAVNFTDTIAKLKALRGLWFQVAQAYGFNEYRPEDLHIHVRTEPLTDGAYEPHGNMIFTTLAAVAAVIGGCNSLTLKVVDEDHTTMNRVARNVSSIIKEESHLNKVTDPLSGSYTLEVITDQLAKKAWEFFQSKVRR